MAPRALSYLKDYSTRFLAGKYSPSILSDIEVETAGKKFQLPEGYTVRAPRKDELPNSTSQQDLCIYQDQVRLGLTFSKLSILTEILNLTQLSLAMLTPNMVCTILTLNQFCQIHNIEWSSEVFFHLFSLKSFSQYVAYRSRKTTFLIHGTESSIHDWKIKYFLIHSPNGWDFPVVPSPLLEDVVITVRCPKSLKTWFNEHPMDEYVLNVKTCDMMTSAQIKEIKVKKGKDKRDSESSKGKQAASKPPPAKKRKITQSGSRAGQSKKVVKANVQPSSSDSESSSDSSSTDSDNSPNDSADIDIVTEEIQYKTKAEELAEEINRLTEEPQAQDLENEAGDNADTDDSEEESEGYFINQAGNLEIKHDSDIPLILDPYKDFGVDLAKFTESKTEKASFERIPHRYLMQLYNSSVLSASRIGNFLSESATHWRSSYDEMKEAHAEALQKIDTLKEESRTEASSSGTAAMQIKSFETEIDSLNEIITVAAKLNKDQTAEIEQLQTSVSQKDELITAQKTAIAEKDKEIELLKKQLEEKASTSRELSIEEQFEKTIDSKPYIMEMVKFMKQGFEIFRRAMLRQTQDPSLRVICEAVDFYKANDEEDVDNDNDE